MRRSRIVGKQAQAIPVDISRPDQMAISVKSQLMFSDLANRIKDCKRRILTMVTL
jgi:hypothetical protein